MPEATCLFLRATEKGTGCVYALKHFRTKEEYKGEDLPSPFYEIDLLASLNHPNIVNISGAAIGRSEADVFMVMEYVDTVLDAIQVNGNVHFSLRQVGRSHHTLVLIGLQ